MLVHSYMSPATLAWLNCRTAFPTAAVFLLSYSFVNIIKKVAILYEQIGNSIADVMANAVFGILIWGHCVREVCREEECQAAGSFSICIRVFRAICRNSMPVHLYISSATLA